MLLLLEQLALLELVLEQLVLQALVQDYNFVVLRILHQLMCFLVHR
jgi:hypothetical protein